MRSSFLRPAALLLCLVLTLAIALSATAGGTAYLVKDLNPNSSPASSYPTSFVRMGPYLFFTQTDGQHNAISLWRTDGTDEGTIRLASGGSGKVVWNGRLWFRTSNANEIGVTDGTPERTAVIPLPAAIDWKGGPIAGPDGLYYISGSKLWRTAGMPGDMTVVSGSGPTFFTGRYETDSTAIIGQTLYFLAGTTVNGVTQMALWRTDATGTSIVFAPAGASTLDKISAVGSLLYLEIRVNGYNYGTQELWRSDGTAAGSYRLKSSAFYSCNPAPVLGSTLYFSVYGSTPALWKTDGTVAGTMAANVPAAATTAIGRLANGMLLLSEDTSSHRLWTYDGTTATEIASGVTAGWPMVTAGNQSFLLSATALWRTDGTTAGTISLGPVGAPDSYQSDRTTSMAAIGSTVFFCGSESSHGSEPWKSDGTLDGTTMLKDLVPATYGSYPGKLTPLRGGVMFTAAPDDTGTPRPVRSLWFSDGTSAGTTMVLPGNSNGTEDVPFVCGGLAYFSHATDETGSELWSSDGSASGTHLVKDIYPGSSGQYVNSSGPFYFTCVDNHMLFFAGTGDAYSPALWRTDGTSDGTFMVKDNLSPSQAPVVVGHAAYFARGVQLWRTDGTPGGTHIVTDVPGGISQMRAAGRLLYFSAPSPLNRDVSVLWCTDGTEAGTRPLLTGYWMNLRASFYDKLIVSLQANYPNRGLYAVDDTSSTEFNASLSESTSSTVCFVPLNGRLYYNTPALTSSDGLTSFVTGVGDFDAILVSAGGRLYARKPSAYPSGYPIVETDGTPSGTTVIHDGYAREAAAREGRLFIAEGELYAYDLPVTVTSFQPAAVPTSGGNVTLSGRGFTAPAAVMVGGAPAAVTSATSTAISIVAPPQSPGTYAIDLTLGDGRMMSTDTPLEYTCAPPTASIDAIAPGYFPFAPVALHGSGGVRCEWFPPIGLDDPSSCSPQASISTTTTYNLVVFNAAGCASANHASVRVYISSLTAPAALRASVDAPAHVSVTWNSVSGATGYEVARMSAGSPLQVIATVQTTAYSETVQSGTYVYRVRAVAATGAPSPYSNGDVASTVAFTDDPLVPQENVIRAIHLTELRTTVDALRSMSGLGGMAWSSGITAGVTPIAATDIGELRSALADALTALGAPMPSYSRSVAGGDQIRATDLQEVRNALR